MIIDGAKRLWTPEAPTGALRIPEYAWGQFATNGGGNRGTGPADAMQWDSMNGERVAGDVHSTETAAVSFGVPFFWVYMRTVIPIAWTTTSQRGGTLKINLYTGAYGMAVDFHQYGNPTYLGIKYAWQKQDGNTHEVQNTSTPRPGQDGKAVVQILRFDVTNKLISYKISFDENEWFIEFSDYSVPGMTIITSGHQPRFNANGETASRSEPAPNSELVEACVSYQDYSDAEDLVILRQGMETAFGI